MIIGLDEVGRGALAGPVVVGAAVLLDEAALSDYPDLKDSKQLSPRRREAIARRLREDHRWHLSHGEVDATIIDSIGIMAALRLAANQALQPFLSKPFRVVADAGLFHGYESMLPTERIIKGDTLVPHIMAAAIHAKVYRDSLMCVLANTHPAYGWERNKGYGTKQHIGSCLRNGYSPHHRQTFCAFCPDAHV